MEEDVQPGMVAVRLVTFVVNVVRLLEVVNRVLSTQSGVMGAVMVVEGDGVEDRLGEGVGVEV